MSRKKDGTEIETSRCEPGAVRKVSPINGHTADLIIMDDIIEDYADMCARHPGGLRRLYEQYWFGGERLLPNRFNTISHPPLPEGHARDKTPGGDGESNI